MKSLIRKVRNLFKEEWTWRLFLVLQVIAILGLVFIDTTTGGWTILPGYHDRIGWHWDIFEESYWTRKHLNWYALICIFGPFLVSKATDWIYEAKKT